ncbi:MAG: PAS domain-containing sensor histidine kinase, partial [Bacteroidota bacterium]
ARDAVLITTADDPNALTIIYANASFKHLTGFSPEEAIGQDLSFVKITERHHSRYEVLMESIKRGAPYAFECQVYRKDGTQFWADWHVSPVFDEQRRLTNWVIIKRDITIKKRILDEMTRQKLRYHEQLTHAMLHAQDQERQRIAEELHDSVGHNLSVMGMHLSLLKEKAQKTEDPEMLSAVNNLHEILTEATREVRNTSRNLSPSLLVDFGLEAAIRNLLSRLESAESMEVEYDLTHLERELPSNTQLSIYRIVQELVNNTMKHSGASRITLRITIEDDDALQMYYADDGKGFNMEKVESQPGGLGLKNMLMRASVMDGFITFFSKPGEGMRVELRVPNISNPHKTQGLEFRPDPLQF